jgi:polysaccharide export outer membrane protein
MSPVLDGVQCDSNCNCGELGWKDARPIPFQAFLYGEYIGPHRLSHLDEYRLRVGDQLELVFRKTVEPSPEPYRLNVGDQIRVSSYTDANLDTLVTIQPDGMITLRLLDQVRAEGRTIEELEKALDDLYREFYKEPSITVKPELMETRLNELRASVDSRYGFGGQGRRATVAPDGTIQLPGIGSLPAQGLTTDELQREINERYRLIVYGIEVTPVLALHAPRFVYVLGEVNTAGRYELTGPTTVIQAITLANGWRVGGNLRQIVIFRRTDDWRLIATRVDIRGSLYGHRPCPADDLWVRDSDIIIVPKSPIKVADDYLGLLFTDGIYRILPNQQMIGFTKLSTL